METIYANLQSEPAEWLFFLTNVCLSTGDFRTSISAGEPPSHGIEFSLYGRKWRLWDGMKEDRKNKTVDPEKPHLSGILKVTYQKGDTEEEIGQLVDDIGFVLSVAMSRTVTWTSNAVLDSSGNKLRGNARDIRSTPFNLRRFQPITNQSQGSLSQLLESSIPIVSAEREWYRRTLDLLLQAQLAAYYEVRCHLLYTLAERIATKAVVKSGKAEIDPDLKSRARNPDFIDKLHAVLTELSPNNWSSENTDAVLGEIKRWNKMPSFVTKIQRACVSLGLVEPEKELLRPRNILLHDGDLNVEKGENHEHYLTLDRVVLTMTLRLLGYQGEFYHPNCGDDPVPILSNQPTD